MTTTLSANDSLCLKTNRKRLKRCQGLQRRGESKGGRVGKPRMAGEGRVRACPRSMRTVTGVEPRCRGEAQRRPTPTAKCPVALLQAILTAVLDRTERSRESRRRLRLVAASDLHYTRWAIARAPGVFGVTHLSRNVAPNDVSVLGKPMYGPTSGQIGCPQDVWASSGPTRWRGGAGRRALFEASWSFALICRYHCVIDISISEFA